MKYLHVFKNDIDYQIERLNNYLEPWVSATNISENGGGVGSITSYRVNYNKNEEEKNLETPLTFEITSDGNIVWKANNTAYTTTIEYSINDSEWSGISSNTGSSAPSISVVSGDTIQFRGNNNTYSTSSTAYNCFNGTTAGFNIKGNIMSLVDSENFATATTLTQDRTFVGLFSGCTTLTDASQLVLPASNLISTCYASMFRGCTNLKKAPELMATSLANFCYQSMFRDCVNLVSAPSILPASVAPKGCYQNMFTSGKTLTEAPELPATTLGESCYDGMFQNCANLTRAPKLPATILPSRCYANMFQNTKITSAPEILATDFGSNSCLAMFTGCKNLTTAIRVGTNGASMASSSCTQMFQDCTSLTTAPELPATTLADGCYYRMFHNCRSLTTAPSSIGTTDTVMPLSACAQMFFNCTSLTEAPELPATTLVENCYYQLFSYCTNLNYIKCLATDISATDSTYNWVSGVASTGTFVKNTSTDWSSKTGTDGIPENWTIEDVN